ncbi:class I SAM-dependent rRNA methyltransferase [Halioglobus pacificus]|uniref:SAM-dependent methyltransferase n=1 Tax=Parahalioglobus pacificus TaxID=930806 RepID=A0A919CL84_9GAMM|nr:class I SAM-dependent rRNA methyltransferase [Halioglobus pacificus]NQY03341.1 class I SAM-dependent rRNA methyltransferase [Halieaceae bacterium]GHD35352.1 SAM-dependent methyltransferase [Halioglobus pacificus]
MHAELPDLILRKGADRRLRAGHLWVFSNEVDTERSPLSAFSAGDPVVVRGTDGRVLGSAYVEPNALICARLYAPNQMVAPDAGLFSNSLGAALEARQQFFDAPFYRLVYGDSDLLPGLVVDRFGDYLVCQFNNAGIERYQAQVIDALVSQLSPEGVLLRSDSRNRREQGLEDRIETVFGDVPAAVPLEENGVRFEAPVKGGQKTGWFYDHRLNRARLQAFSRGARVLDVYSYIGGWGIQAAAAGADSVICVDSSQAALDAVAGNAALNGVGDQVSCEQGRADAVMQALAAAGEQFDIVVLDPPAFVQRRKDLKKGIAAYRRINELGLRLLRPGGLLVAGSCSMHMPRLELNAALQGAARRSACELRIVEQGGQGPDHPIHPAIPETEYLKAVFARRMN